ncbi:MAG: isoprenyl transferase [Tannerellaceae bacterium]|jgi:undecaprenyl diphosphate synthase|nr:isoprenyl transferase [Tannerellaceae bacterium]
MSLIDEIKKNPMPQHIAIIMDGNGRWAQAHGKDRSFGHQEGVASVRKTVEAAAAVNLPYITVYTFSSENWNRPASEIEALMSLLAIAVRRETPDLMANNVRLMAIGNLERLPEAARHALQESINQTSGNTGTTLVLALSYSARWEITEAARRIATQAAEGSLNPIDINEEIFSNHLSTQNIPDPDLLIRTGGEKRISNFLLWQMSYAELYFTDLFWPDFKEQQLYEAILYYQQRERRFGKTSEQLNL